MQPNIVFLDEYSLGDADLGSIRALGNYTGYRTTVREEVADRCREADVVITNKVVFRRETLRQLPRLRLICVAATGMNHIDLEAAAELGIAVKNAVGYSTHAVTETTIGAAIGLLRQTVYYDRYVKTAYAGSPLQYHFGRTTHQLYGSKWGIVGLGNIGRSVARVAEALGCRIAYTSTSGVVREEPYPEKPLDELLRWADVVSVHAPLNDRTRNLIGARELALMKPSAILINVARGGIVLLKNEGGMLPFSSKVRDVVVMGPNAGRVPTGGGAGFVHPFSTVSVGEGMRAVGKRLRTTVLDPAPVGDLAASGLFFTPDGRPGLRGEFFAGKELAGMPVATQVDAAIDFDWEGSPADGVPADGFSARWSGSFKPAATGRVTFVVRGDDGYRLYVDGREVLADWRDHAATTRSATLDVVAGKSYAVRLEYYDNASTASVSLRYLFENVTDRERRIAAADAVIYCAGFDSDTERENHDRTFALPEGQAAEIAAVAKLNANLVVVVNSGGGVDFAQFADRARAILMAWYPGQEGGRAVAEILTGAVSPSGKLPISIERRAEDNPCYGSYYENVDRSHRKGAPQPRVNYDEGIFVGYRGYDRTATEPLYAFGYGLSYTTFAYSGLKVVRQDDGSCRVSFDVRNTGRRDGAEVAQLYVSDLAASVPRPVKELKGYEKVFLKRGETKRVEILLPHDAFAFYDTVRHDFVVEPGDFLIQVGASSRDLRLKGTIRVD